MRPAPYPAFDAEPVAGGAGLGPGCLPEIQVRPDVVEIGAFFDGQEVKISAKIPQEPRR